MPKDFLAFPVVNVSVLTGSVGVGLVVDGTRRKVRITTLFVTIGASKYEYSVNILIGKCDEDAPLEQKLYLSRYFFSLDYFKINLFLDIFTICQIIINHFKMLATRVPKNFLLSLPRCYSQCQSWSRGSKDSTRWQFIR